MAKPKIDKNKLLHLRNQLEHGDLQRIGDQLGIGRSTVAKVLKGEFRNIDVIEQALRLVNHRKKIIKSLHSSGITSKSSSRF